MKLIDMSRDKPYTLQSVKREWIQFRAEDPENHSADFMAELFEVLMDTVNGRNDLKIAGPTAAETGRIILRLCARIS